jgi:hypothetical protein
MAKDIKLFRGDTTQDIYGVDDNDLHDLAIYNAEVSRGIMHRVSYQQKMAKLQARYDAALEKRRG